MHTGWDVFQWGVGTPQANSPLRLETLPLVFLPTS